MENPGTGTGGETGTGSAGAIGSRSGSRSEPRIGSELGLELEVKAISGFPILSNHSVNLISSAITAFSVPMIISSYLS